MTAPNPTAEIADCIREACRESGLDPTRHLSPEVGVRRLVGEIARLKAHVEEAERKQAIDQRQCDEMTSEAGRLAGALREAESRADAEAANGAMLREALTAIVDWEGPLHGPSIRNIGLRVLAAAPSLALARVQWLVEAALAWRTRKGDGMRETLALYDAIDAITGTNAGDGNG